MAVEAIEETAYGTLVCAVVGDFSEVEDALISASASGCWAASVGCWTAMFEAPVVISALPRCPAEAGCSLGKFGRCGGGDIAIVRWDDPSIEILNEIMILCSARAASLLTRLLH